MGYLIQDGDFTVASAVSSLKPSSGTPDGKLNLVSQDFMQFVANFAALDYGTPHPTLAGYYLVEETAPQMVGGGVARWTRTYGKVPDSHDEYQSYGFNRIGYTGTFGPQVTAVTGRDRRVIEVQSKIVHDYFLVGSATYPTAESIPLIAEQRYTNATGGVDVDYIWDGSPSSVPSLATYVGLVAAGTYIVAVASECDRWRGPIYVRKTRNVKAI